MMMKPDVIVILLFCYSAFLAVSWKANKEGNLKLVDEFGSVGHEPLRLIVSHLSGMFFLGVIPLVFFKNVVLQLIENIIVLNSVNTLSFASCSLILLFIAFWQGKMLFEKTPKADDVKEAWNYKWVAAYFIVRLLYLGVYEFWFRGLLLFVSVEAFGVIPAVVINVFLYVLIHVFSGKKEMLACFPFGLFVCFFTLAFNSVWPAIFLHIGISFVYEYSFLRLFIVNFKTSKS